MEPTSGHFDFIIRAFQTGGFWVYPIAICLALSVAIALERFVRLYLQFPTHGMSFWHEIRNLVLADDLDGAIKACNAAGEKVLPKVLRAGLSRASRDETQIQNALDAATLEVLPKLERRIPYLSLIANIATLMGLLGTISGLIAAFNAVSNADPQARQAILSAGIAEAMNATAFGLVTAIFSMVAHSFLSNQAAHIAAEVDEFGVKLMDLVSARNFKHSSERGE
jgi:biopolymer transport protein ExbB